MNENKTWIAAIATVVGFLLFKEGDPSTIATAVATLMVAFAVYLVPNFGTGIARYSKAIVAAVSTILCYFLFGVGDPEVVTTAIATIVTTLCVFIVPNRPVRA